MSDVFAPSENDSAENGPLIVGEGGSDHGSVGGDSDDGQDSVGGDSDAGNADDGGAPRRRQRRRRVVPVTGLLVFLVLSPGWWPGLGDADDPGPLDDGGPKCWGSFWQSGS